MFGLDAVQFAGASARVRGLQSQLLGREVCKSLIGAESLDDALAILRTGAYADILDAAQSRGLGLEVIERRLMGRAAANCRKSMTFLTGASRRVLLVWWQHFELENLKAVFRGIDQGMSPDMIESFMVPLGAPSTLPWQSLLHEHSVPSLIERLDGTRYINPLRNAFHMYQRDRSLFGLEVALDIRYYRDIVAAAKNLETSARAEAFSLLGTQLDILNILWAFRYRVYYGLSAEEIVNYTLWHTTRTDANLVRTIALGASPADVVERVWGRGAVDLEGLGDAQNEVDQIPGLEMALLRFWRGLALKQTHGYPFRLGAILGYLILEELEVQDLVRILEGKILEWDSERIRQHLIRVVE